MLQSDCGDDAFFESDLPIALKRLLGLEGYLKFVENFGGLRFYVPMSLEITDLASKLGEENLSKLIDQYGGLYIRVPLGRSELAQAYHRRGLTRSQIARLLRITESGVGRLLKRAKSEATDGEQ